MNESHQQTVKALEEKLRAERPRFSPRDGFTERVMDHLPPRVPRSSENSKRVEPFRWSWLMAAFAAAACIVLIIFQVLPRQDLAPVVVNNPPSTVDPKPFHLPAISFARVDEFTAKLDQPLEKEMKNVISDTRQAIQFVASNFLPENQN